MLDQKSETLQLSKIVPQFLQDNPDKKYTARQIAEWILERYPKQCEIKQKKMQVYSDNQKDRCDVLQQIAAEVGSVRPLMQKKNPQIKTTEGRPKKYYYTQSNDTTEIAIAEGLICKDNVVNTASQIDQQLKEADLYPKLSDYLELEMQVVNTRIDEKKSTNTRETATNKWLHPDIAGMKDMTKDWNPTIKECAILSGRELTKLYSFEVKLLINRSNVRESFFQTVSNSTWANFSYLAAAEIQGDETMRG